MTSVRMKYYTQGGHLLLLPKTILNLGYTFTMLTRSFIKIKSLSEDLFCTGDIQTLDYCMEVYSQFLSNKLLDFFISGCWEIDLACQRMERELEKFIIELEKIFHLFSSLLPNESKFLKKLDDTKSLFKKYLIKQFTKVIRKEGKYSSEIFAKLQGIFLETMKYKYFFDKMFSK